MFIDNVKNDLQDYAKDTKLNFAKIFTEEGSPDLTEQQIFMISLGVAYTLKNAALTQAILDDAREILSVLEIDATKAAATIMAMNNIYYRTMHLLDDKSFAAMPVKLRMNIIGNPGIAKKDFELICLSISTINGCGMCINAHSDVLQKEGISKLGVQSAIRIAAVLHSAMIGLDISAH